MLQYSKFIILNDACFVDFFHAFICLIVDSYLFHCANYNVIYIFIVTIIITSIVTIITSHYDLIIISPLLFNKFNLNLIISFYYDYLFNFPNNF